MGRLILFGFVLLITLFIWIVKQVAGKATGSQRLQQTSFKDQTQRTMDATAHGINWLDKQWDEAKRKAAAGIVESATRHVDREQKDDRTLQLVNTPDTEGQTSVERSPPRGPDAGQPGIKLPITRISQMKQAKINVNRC